MITTMFKPIDKKALQSFLDNNKNVNLKTFNFLDNKVVDTLKWPKGSYKSEKMITLKELGTLQRLMRLTDDQDLALELYNKGIHSAIQISAMSKQDFITLCKPLLIEPASTAKLISGEIPATTAKLVSGEEIHKRAIGIKTQAVLTYTALAQHTSAHSRAMKVDNLSVPADNLASNLPSYQDLFGGLDFCICPECRSIFSPAAYFVDLMRMKATYVTDTKVSSLLRLEKRRPDLWELPLTCDNTNTLISTLSVVNEVMENTIKVSYKDFSYKTLFRSSLSL